MLSQNDSFRERTGKQVCIARIYNSSVCPRSTAERTSFNTAQVPFLPHQAETHDKPRTGNKDTNHTDGNPAPSVVTPQLSHMPPNHAPHDCHNLRPQQTLRTHIELTAFDLKLRVPVAVQHCTAAALSLQCHIKQAKIDTNTTPSLQLYSHARLPIILTPEQNSKSKHRTHRLDLKLRVSVGVTSIPAVAPAVLQGSGQLLVLTPQLADGAPQVQHQLVLGVQDAQGVALHPQRHAGKVQGVQRLIGMSLQTTRC